MGYDLFGYGGDFYWNTHGLREVIEIATRHGWKGMGIEAPEETTERDWSGTWLVPARDALELAEALEKFLKEPHQNDEACFLERIREFVEFCRKGSFSVY